MPNEPRHENPIEKLRDQVLAGEVPTNDLAEALEGRATDRSSDVTVQRPASEPTVEGPSRPPDETGPPLHGEPQGKPFGRYRLLGELGHGGMGVVWKAYDTQLRRVVALKGLIAGEFADAAQIERFIREARSAARLSHPGIVPVYDVGEHQGYHYFTTEYIEGTPLDRPMEQPVAVRQSLEWVKAIGEALHYAHVQGVVHRDVKPGNVLVDAAGRPHVMDFGLAKQVEQEGSGPVLTLSGDLLGTPRYMSPEQTRGAGGVGPASDQFSLGVVLYELLTRRPPFDGTSMRDLLNAIAEREPSRPTEVNPKIHRDIETICLKALEKDPACRYASLADMAADIGAYLAGEPIAARPISAMSQLLRRTARHKAVVGLSTAGVLLGIVAVVYALSAKEAGKEKEAAKAGEAVALERMRKSQAVSKVFGRWSLLEDALLEMEGCCYDERLPAEDRAARVGRLWPQVEAFVRETPSDSASQATMAALHGWALKMAGHEPEGLGRMEEAAAIDPEVPYGTMMRALASFWTYVERPESSVFFASDEGQGPAPPDAEQAEAVDLRRDVEALVDRVAKATVWGRDEAESFAASLEAIRAMRAADYAAAEEGLTRALAAPALRAFQTGLLVARARARYSRGDFAGAIDDAKRAARVRTRDGFVRTLQADAVRGQAQEALLRGEDPRPLLEEAIALHEEAMRLSPSRSDVPNNLGNALRELGEARAARGEDPMGEYERAARAYGEALDREPGLVEARINRAGGLVSLGEALIARGQDPRETYGRAVEDLGRAIEASSPSAWALSQRALARLRLGQAQAAIGVDPRATFDASIADGGAALELDEGFVVAWLNRGLAWEGKGHAEASLGIDSIQSFDRAIADYGEAVRRSPRYADAWANRAIAWSGRGEAQAGRGGDPTESFTKAIEDAGQAIEIRSDRASFFNTRGQARRMLGEAQAARGVDPSAAHDAAIDDFGKAIERNPTFAFAYNNRAIVWLCKGNLDAARGADPTGALEKAIADLGEALRLNLNYPEAYNNRGNARHDLALAQGSKGKDPRPLLRECIEDFGQALSRNPRFGAVYNNRGFAWKDLGDHEAAQGEDPRPSYDRAIADCTQALSINPTMLQALSNRAAAHAERGAAEALRGGDRRDGYEKAIEDFRRMMQIAPESWQAYANAGTLLEQIGRPEEAIPLYEKAISIVGDGFPALKEWLDRARAARPPK